ncbi:MAG: dolichyl-phosphate beta-glucosyltransferase [Pyrinomonadaceae bacterium]
MPVKLSIVVPAYNEAARLKKTLPVFFNYLAGMSAKAELIIVDDGSTDDTADISRKLLAGAGELETRLISYSQNRGKGHAVRTGFLAAKGAVGVFSDADLSTPITETPKLIVPIISGSFDVTFGSRALNRRLIGSHQPWLREQGGRVFNLVVRLMTGLKYWDTQCGFKAFRMDVCRPLFETMKTAGFGFDVELLLLAEKAGLRLHECPVRWDHCEGSRLDLWHDSRRTFAEVNRIRRRLKSGEYEDALESVRRLAKENCRIPIDKSWDKNSNTAPSDFPAELADPARRI